MAECIRHVCSNCGNTVDAWSDGNPYYIDENGEKQYAYHPNHDKLVRCIGNDSPHICLDCGEQFKVDSRSPLTKCPKCDSLEIPSTYQLEGKRCPVCKDGVFGIDPDFRCIS